MIVKSNTAEQCPDTIEKAEAMLDIADKLIRRTFSSTVVNGNIITLYSGGDITIRNAAGTEIELGNARSKEIDMLIILLPQLINCVRGV